MTVNQDDLRNFQEFLYKNIPISKNMGLILSDYRDNTLILKAPIIENINDKGSVFGGSGSALMILAAWSMIKLNCEESQVVADIVIHKNETVWHKAMYSDLIIEAVFMKKYNFKLIKDLILNNKHQRIDCQIKLKDNNGDLFSTMIAKYVIIPKT